MKPISEVRIAIVHEWPVVYAGSEQVVAAMLEVFPRADLYALVHDPESLRGTPLEGVPIRTSFIQSLPRSEEKYRLYLPLMPLAVEQFDLRRYDIVISSNHAVAKGVLTGSDQVHVGYVHTPVRYAWDLYWDYLTESGLDRGIKGWLAQLVLHYIRLWDLELPPIGRKVSPFAGRAQDAQSSGELLKLPNEGVYPYARDPIVLHRAHLGAVVRPATTKGSEPPFRLPPPSHTRSSGL